MAFGLAGTGVYVPALRDGRPRAGSAETTSAMAAAAAGNALGAAGWAIGEVDALIGASSVTEQPIPGTAALIGRRLGLRGAAMFDVGATCLSALVALDLAITGVAAGRWRRVLIAGADLPSRAIDPAETELAAIFGDGGAALAVGEGGHEVLASRFETYPQHAELCTIEAGGTRLDPRGDFDAFLAASRFRMAGPALYRATARLFPGFLERLLGAAGVASVDLVIPHQASRPAIDHLRHVLGVDPARMVDLFDAYGNQVASSLPHALHVAATSGRLRPGMAVLLIGSAAGVSLGGMVVRW
jgi:3-oxoacyl-[acyl-carrier-protein] synthase III